MFTVTPFFALRVPCDVPQTLKEIEINKKCMSLSFSNQGIWIVIKIEGELYKYKVL